MPTKRILYTLLEIKSLLARIHQVKIENVEVFENETLFFDDYHLQGGDLKVENNTFLFQITK